MKKQKWQLLLAGIALIIMIVIAAYFIAPSSTVTFEEPGVEAMVQAEVGEGTVVTKEHLKEITSLDISNQHITSLTDLKKFPNLRELSANHNQIQDLTPLSELEHLQSLSLEGNQIRDLSPLQSLQHLRQLNVSDNSIQSLEPLREIASLTHLEADTNHIADITALEGLSYLEVLSLRDNRVESIAPLSSLTRLRQLDISSNLVSDFSPLAPLERLKEQVYISGNPFEVDETIIYLYENTSDIDISDPRLRVEASVESGTYEQPIKVRLLSDYKDGIIRYTLDGSEPTAASKAYNQRNEHPKDADPITIEETTVLRAKLFTPDQQSGDTLTKTYFFGESPSGDLPVLHLSMNPDDLFGDEKGIYAKGKHFDPDAPNPNLSGNFMQEGRDWERKVHVSYYPKGFKEPPVFSQDAGIRIHGGASRGYDRKSFRLYARDRYGTHVFPYPMFGEDGPRAFKRLILRNSGNDWDKTMFRDAMIQQLVSDMEVETQAYQPVLVYLNGEYFGLYNLRERYDHHYMRWTHNVNERDLDLLENNHVEVKKGSRQAFDELMAYVQKNGLEDATHYRYVKEHIDLENFMDTWIVNIYARNLDWPGNNQLYWRNRNGDGKWRWLLVDLDFGYNMYREKDEYLHEMEEHNTLAMAADPNGDPWPNPPWATLLFRSLLAQEDFKNEFVARFTHRMNTVFDPDRTKTLIREMKATIEPAMPDLIEKWEAPASMEEWEKEIRLMERFAERRPDYMRQHIVDFFHLDGKVEIKVNSFSNATSPFTVNELETENFGPRFTGTYVTNIPYRFSLHQNETWTTSNEAVAQIEQDGRVTFLEEGKATLTAVNENGEELLQLTVVVTHS